MQDNFLKNNTLLRRKMWYFVCFLWSSSQSSSWDEVDVCYIPSINVSGFNRGWTKCQFSNSYQDLSRVLKSFRMTIFDHKRRLQSLIFRFFKQKAQNSKTIIKYVNIWIDQYLPHKCRNPWNAQVDVTCNLLTYMTNLDYSSNRYWTWIF